MILLITLQVHLTLNINSCNLSELTLCNFEIKYRGATYASYKMLDEKLLQILSHPADGEVAIVTQGIDGPHVVNTWNSYVCITPDGRMLIPAGRMIKTEKNIEKNHLVKLTVGSREVLGLSYKGAGFLITGTAKFLKDGPGFELIKEKFSWARAALEITIENAVQTL